MDSSPFQPPRERSLRMAGFHKLVERRDLWSIGVYRYDRLDDIFTAPPVEFVHFHGETGLRVRTDYQSVAADPFLFVHGDSLYLFYEVKTDHGHGTIHAKSMSRDGCWSVHGQVLVEPFHLSYPQVFALDGRIFMLPEAAQSGEVRLYEAEDFPYRWRYCTTLVDAPLRDPTLLVTEDDGLFLLVTTADYQLKLCHARCIDAPFTDCGLIITQDLSLARCAGGILKLRNQFLRPAQDCSETYGKRITFQLIDSLSPSRWKERPTGLSLKISPSVWMSRGSHHVSCANFSDAVFVAIDGRGPDLVANSLTLGLMRIVESAGITL